MRKLWTPRGYMPLGAVALDVDGVQRDTNIIAHRSISTIIEQYGGKAPSYAEHITKDYDHIEWCHKHGATIDITELRKVYYEIHPPDHETGPFADVAGFCKSVALLGLDLFVVSSCREDWLLPWFEQHSLGTHFAYIVHTARPKEPHLLDVCNQLGVDPEHTMYVGDMGHDMHAAHNVGMIPVGITRGYHDAERPLRDSGAKLVVRSLEHLSHLMS